eukprot:Selendium_serpulae@DN9038_c0_g1_i1.p1
MVLRDAQRDATLAEKEISQMQEKLSNLDTYGSGMAETIARLEAEMSGIEEEMEQLRGETDRMKVTMQDTVTKRQALKQKERELLERTNAHNVSRRQMEREKKDKDLLTELKSELRGVHGYLRDLCQPTTRQTTTRASRAARRS